MGRRTASSSSTISTRSPASDPAGALAPPAVPRGDSEGGVEGARAGAGAGARDVAESGAEACARASGSDRTKRAPKPGGDGSVRSPPRSEERRGGEGG